MTTVAPTFFYLSLRDLYLPLVPEMNSALPKLLTGFTAFFFSQVLSDFFSAFITHLERLDVQIPTSCSALPQLLQQLAYYGVC